MRISANFLVLVTILVFFVGNVFAGFNCKNDPSVPIPPAPTPIAKLCLPDTASTLTMKECLQGGVTPDPANACIDDPRYQLRNFAPMLNFPTIGSMLNLGVALITSVAGLVCGVIMFYGAYKYLSAGGEMKKIEEARNRMIYAGIGLLVVLLAYSIVKVLLDITSTNTVGF